MVVVDLKNPWIAGVLAWLVPGLGHYYQGRRFKSILFAACIIPTFLFGCLLGSSKEVGFARNVYFSWRNQDRRLFFIPQSGVGTASLFALFQARQINGGAEPFFNGAMCPPISPNPENPRKSRGYPPSLDEIIDDLGRNFEVGTIFTVVAGLMNILVVFDAIDGPLFYRKEEEDEKGSKKREKEKEKNDPSQSPDIS